MNTMDKLEKKYGKYAIPNITNIMLVFTLVGYGINFLGMSNIVNYLEFDMNYILKGQVWRLVSWLFVPAGSISILSLLFLLCLFMLGQNLENYLGSFRMNVYFIGGILLNDLLGILVYFATSLAYVGRLTGGISPVLSLYYIMFSLYLMLGIFLPDATVRLYFILPIKMKWLNILYIGELAYEIFSYCRYGAQLANAYGVNHVVGAMQIGIAYGGEIVFALLNLVIFFALCKSRISHKQKKRQQEFKQQFNQPRPGSGISKHKCAICGRTEADDPSLSFRYCSKCAGSYEYCQDHLFTHQHITFGKVDN